MEYCTQWHPGVPQHAPASMAPPHTQPMQSAAHYDSRYFYGSDGRADYGGEPAVDRRLDAAYQQYWTSAISAVQAPANAVAANGGRAGANGGYGPCATVGYPHAPAVVAAGYGNVEALQLAGHPVPEGASPHEAALYARDAYQLNQASTSRAIRNMAEKHRRDKLNGFIQELASLVPMVSNSPKRLDKTSILRLAVTFLRMHWVLPAPMNQSLRIPKFIIDQVDWDHLLQSSVDGALLVVTAVGKIVFLTHNIENILGYTQTELSGLSLYNITSPEDHAELRKALTPDGHDENATDSIGELEDLQVTSSEPITNSGSSPSYTTSRSSVCRASSSSHDSNDSTLGYERQYRSFFLRLSHRNPARSEKPQYELVRVQGHLTVPKILTSEAQKKSRKNKVEVTSTPGHRILLFATMERLPGRRVTELSMLEPSKDEYVTRHTLQGQILYSDHRISTVAGYLSDEVNGFQAFNFMHQDDAPWVALALFQMFARGEAFGLSCYRLQTKNKSHIYLKSYGLLEYNASTETYGSFICVNSLVPKEEGERAITEMKNRYRPLIEAKEMSGNNIPAELCNIVQKDGPSLCAATPMDINAIVEELISQVGVLKADAVHEDPEKSELPQYLFAKLISKHMPPVQIQLQNMKQNSPAGASQMSPSTPSSPLQEHPPQQKPERQRWSSSSSAGSPPAASSNRMTQDRPSVLRIAPSSSSCKPVTVYPVDINISSSSTVSSYPISNSASCNGGTECGDCGISSSVSGRSGTGVTADSENRLYSNCKQNQIIQPEFIKQESTKEENVDRIQGAFSSSVATSSCKSGSADSMHVKEGVTMATSVEQTSCDRIGVVVQRGARGGEKYGHSGSGGDGRSCTKRPHELHHDNSSSVPMQKRLKEEDLEDEVQLSMPLFQLSNNQSTFPPLNIWGRDPSVSLGSQLSNYSVGALNSGSVTEFDLPDPDSLDRQIQSVQSTLFIQSKQIADIENNLEEFPPPTQQLYRERVNQLQRERKQHQQYLKTIESDFSR